LWHPSGAGIASGRGRPVKDVIPPDQALLFVQEVRDRFTVVALNEDEYVGTIEQTAEYGFETLQSDRS
jgi:hypothetical protein